MTEQTVHTKSITEIASRWSSKQGSLIMVLHEIQNKYGYIPRDVAMELSRIIDVPLARIYEVITFYNYFKLQPPGKFNIAVCMGTACYLKGAPDILDEISERLILPLDRRPPMASSTSMQSVASVAVASHRS